MVFARDGHDVHFGQECEGGGICRARCQNERAGFRHRAPRMRNGGRAVAEGLIARPAFRLEIARPGECGQPLIVSDRERRDRSE